jgi:hypothetical protein
VQLRGNSTTKKKERKKIHSSRARAHFLRAHFCPLLNNTRQHTLRMTCPHLLRPKLQSDKVACEKNNFFFTKKKNRKKKKKKEKEEDLIFIFFGFKLYVDFCARCGIAHSGKRCIFAL